MVTQLWQQWRHARRATQDERRQLRVRAALLKRVRQTWVNDVLDGSLQQRAQIALGLNRRPEVALQRPEVAPLRRMELQRQGREPEPLEASTRISRVFNEADGRLLILGLSGSGRTTVLLELARDLIDLAEQDAEQPIPVVFNLASWTRQQRPLADWMVDELRNSYEVPRRIAQAWVDANRILPLLDGLDEVSEASHRTSAKTIDGIQELSDRTGKLVLCGRIEEYRILATHLGMPEALILQPLTREQVYDYLEAVGRPLAAVSKALRDNELLWEWVASPLMLNIVTLTYQERSADALWAEQPQVQLWEAYTKRMFARWPFADRHYTNAKAKHWLSWLAQSMRERNQSQFDLDRLQPDCLPAWQRWLVKLAPALLAGAIGYVLVWWGIRLVLGQTAGSRVGLGVGGLILGIAAAVVLALVAFGGRGAYLPVETRRWSWWEMRVMELIFALGVAFVVAQIFGSVVALVVGLVLGLIGAASGPVYRQVRGDGVKGTPTAIAPVEKIYWSSAGLLGGATSVQVIGLGVGLVVALIVASVAVNVRPVFGLIGARIGWTEGLRILLVIGGFSRVVGRLDVWLDERAAKGAIPNESIHRSGHYGLGVGLGVALAVALAVALVFGPRLGPVVGLLLGLLFGLVFGLEFGLEFGGIAWLRHFTLRGLLFLNRAAPLGYVGFLDDATDRLFLYRSGRSYIFVHRLLLEYFAGRRAVPSATDADGGADLSRQMTSSGGT